MGQKRNKNQKKIVVIPEDQITILSSDTKHTSPLPPNCYIVPMVILKEPKPIPKALKRRKRR